jgi:site-specific DNA-methyltransferase (adenine-specific)
MAISRVHETVSIYSKGKGIIRKVKVPYLEMKKHDIAAIITDIKRLRSTFTNAKSMKAVCDFLENNFVGYADCNFKYRTTANGDHGVMDRCVGVIKGMEEGNNEKTIISGLQDGQKPIRTDRTDCDNFTKFYATCDKRQIGDRCANVAQSIEFGLNEKTIVSGIPHPDGLIPVQ